MTGRAIVLASAFVLASAAPAESQVYLGAEANWAQDFDLGVGLRLDVPVEAVHEQFWITGSFIYFFPGESSEGLPGVQADIEYWEANANARFRIETADGGFTPYIGSGVNLANVSGTVSIAGAGSTSQSDTKIGLNLLAGVEFGRGPSRPFLEGRFEVGGGEQFVVAGGISIPLGN